MFVPKFRRLPETIVGEADHESPPVEFKLQPLRVLSCNIRSILGKLDELAELLRQLDVHVVCIQESWLDISVLNPIVPNFYIVSRVDRGPDPNRGGVITYARQDVNNISRHDFPVPSKERVWHLVHRDSGALAICNWYFSSSVETMR